MRVRFAVPASLLAAFPFSAVPAASLAQRQLPSRPGRKETPVRRLLTVLLAALGLTVMAAGPAAAQSRSSRPIRPKQYFVGEVNGQIRSSVLSVVGCPAENSGVAPSGDGHPLAGQTVSAERIIMDPPGYTGQAHRLRVDLAVSPNPRLPLIYLIHVADLSNYGSAAQISSTITLPCAARVTAVFTPIDGGQSAVPSTVALRLEGPAISLVPDVARPGDLISARGSGFAPDSTYTLAECSKTSWIVPQYPCAANPIPEAVTTDNNGSFVHRFLVEDCPGPVPAGLREHCFIGVPSPVGVDGVILAGAAPLTVVEAGTGRCERDRVPVGCRGLG